MSATPQGRKRPVRESSSTSGQRGLKKFFTPAAKRERVKIEAYNPRCYSIPICGINVQLPENLTPYRTQKLMIVRILTALKRKENMLAESPTGSGKTMALLSSTCAYLADYNTKREDSLKKCMHHNALRCKDSYNSAFPSHESSLQISENSIISQWENDDNFDRSVLLDGTEPSSSTKENEPCTCLPRVRMYYGTRTHKQIGQVVREYSRLPYGNILKHTILGSREQLCINEDVRNKPDLTAACKDLIKGDGMSCSFKTNMRDWERPGHMRQFIAKSGSPVWDIEDLVDRFGKSRPQMCPYFTATRLLAQDADVIFCPFTYLMDPIIRSMTEVKLKNCIIILDEAHNVDDMCRDAATFTFTEREINDTISSLNEKKMQLRSSMKEWCLPPQKEEEATAPEGSGREISELRKESEELLHKLVEMEKHMDTLLEFSLELHSWLAGISENCIPSGKAGEESAQKTMGWQHIELSLSDQSKNRDLNFAPKTPRYERIWKSMVWLSMAEAGEGKKQLIERLRPSGASIVCVEKFLYFLQYFNEDRGRGTYRLHVAVQRNTLEGVAQLHSAGPRNMAYQTEAGTGSETSWSSPSQSVGRSPLLAPAAIKPGFAVSASFWCMSPELAFLDAFRESSSVILASGTLCPTQVLRTELGLHFSIEMEGEQVIPKEHIFASALKTGPRGNRLLATYNNMQSNDVFIDELALIVRTVCARVPRGVLCFLPSYRMLERLFSYLQRSTILRQIETKKILLREPRRSSELSAVLTRFETAIRSPFTLGPSIDGAVFFAVYRGKLSEGIDFADDLARCVIAVGIPYPSFVDPLVQEKRKYNDEMCKLVPMLTGEQWYTSQAYRALNQALGRCLRHRDDWGSLVLVDERLAAPPPPSSSPSTARISGWITEQLLAYSNFDSFEKDLTAFVSRMEKKGDERPSPPAPVSS